MSGKAKTIVVGGAILITLCVIKQVHVRDLKIQDIQLTRMGAGTSNSTVSENNENGEEVIKRMDIDNKEKTIDDVWNGSVGEGVGDTNIEVKNIQTKTQNNKIQHLDTDLQVLELYERLELGNSGDRVSEYREEGDIELLELYNSIQPTDDNLTSDILDYIQKNSIAELKADKSLQKASAERLRRLEEEKYKRYVEELFKEKIKAEVEKRVNDKLQRELMAKRNIQISSASIKEEMKVISLAMGLTSNDSKSNTIYNLLPNYLGKPYIWGGDDYTQKGVGYDCSGFTLSVYNKLGKNIPRVSAMQYKEGTEVSVENLQVGDLVFFDTKTELKDGTSKPTQVSHVGLYIGNGLMVHASSGSNRIRTEKVFGSYFAPRYMGARRY